MRVLFMLIAIACVGLTYVLSRDVFHSRLAGVGSAAALLCLQGFAHYATYGPREKTTLVLFVICTLLATFRQRWATAGCFVALATLTLQPTLVVVLASAVVAALIGATNGRWRALARIAVGGLIPSALFVGAYAAMGHLQMFLNDFVLINARYTEQESMLDYPEIFWPTMKGAYGWSLWVFFVGVAGLAVSTAVALLTTGRRRSPETATLVGASAGLVAGILWLMRAFNGWPDPFFLLPAAMLGIGGLIALVQHRGSMRAAVAITAAWAVLATSLTLADMIRDRDDTLVDQRRDVDAVLALLPTDTTILSVEAPQPLVLSGKRNLSRYQLFGNGLDNFIDDSWPGGMDGYGRWIGRKAPTVIALGVSTPPPWLAPELDDSYVAVGESTGWVWYLRTDLPESTLAAVRRALAR